MKESDDIRLWSSQFVSMISHEIRTPLTTIISFAQTLTEEENLPKDDRKYYLKIIENQGKRITHFLTELTEIMRMETGTTLNITKLNLNNLLTSIVNQPVPAAGKPVELVFPSTPCIINADYAQLQTAITILLLYLGERCNGPLSLRLENRADVAHVTIACSRVLLTERELHNLFDINKQLLLSKSETPIKNRPVYAAAIVRGNNGCIWIAATPDNGALISIELLK